MSRRVLVSAQTSIDSQPCFDAKLVIKIRKGKKKGTQPKGTQPYSGGVLFP